jgi:hypothetical protein
MSLLLALAFVSLPFPVNIFNGICCPCGRAFRIEQEIATLVFNPYRIEGHPRGNVYFADALSLYIHPTVYYGNAAISLFVSGVSGTRVRVRFTCNGFDRGIDFAKSVNCTTAITFCIVLLVIVVA